MIYRMPCPVCNSCLERFSLFMVGFNFSSTQCFFFSFFQQEKYESISVSAKKHNIFYISKDERLVMDISQKSLQKQAELTAFRAPQTEITPMVHGPLPLPHLFLDMGLWYYSSFQVLFHTDQQSFPTHTLVQKRAYGDLCPGA